MRTINRIIPVSVTAAAQDIELGGSMFAIQNKDAAATVYFREKDGDGAACTAANGIAVGPGELVDLWKCGGYTLSIIGSAAASAVIIVFD